MKTAILTGQTNEHVRPFEEGVLIHQKVEAPLLRLKTRAAKAGFKLKLASGFRDFEAQLKIWNAKCLGLRPVLDDAGLPLDITQLSPRDLVFAILRWSALPGASRHHWGTDIDVFDSKACESGYRVELVPQEAAPGGPFHSFSEWLEEQIGYEGFFRPYAIDLGGVAPEWWHLSYEPISRPYLEALTQEKIRQALEPAEIRFKDEVFSLLPEIVERYVRNISPPIHSSK